MMLMEIDRRAFLSAVSVAGMGLLMPLAGAAKKMTSSFFYSAYKDANARYGVCRVDVNTGHAEKVSIPFRGHGCYLNGIDSQIIVVGRRPSTSLALVDFTQKTMREVYTNKGRHFYGHATLNRNNTLLYTTENNYQSGGGVIGVRDAKTLAFLGEFSSAGIGPHDIQRLPNSEVLVVANGGVKTHPDYGRRVLNQAHMEPSLAYINSFNGQVLDVISIGDKNLSIRHIDINQRGDVLVAMQSHHQPVRNQSLLAYQPANGDLELLKADGEMVGKMQGYIGDCSFLTDDYAVTSSSRGNCIAVWNLRKKELSNVIDMPGCSGLTRYEKNKVLLSVKNTIAVTGSQTESPLKVSTDLSDVKFDNHCFFG